MHERADNIDKRRFGRRPSSLRATAQVTGRSAMPCLLANVSERGALIYFDQESSMPQSFRLTSEDNAIDQIVQVRYQIARMAGVEFIAPATSSEQVKLIALRTGEFDAWLDLTMR